MPCECVLTDQAGRMPRVIVWKRKSQREQAVDDYGFIFCKWKYAFPSSLVIKNSCNLKIECNPWQRSAGLNRLLPDSILMLIN